MPLQILIKDITTMHCDAIVNTTNENMIGYSGVDKAIHEAAGPLLDLECSTLVPLELGFAKVTKGYNLNCKYVIHTSGPIWKNGKHGEKAILKSCYTECLLLAKKYQCHSIAFPLISSGEYGYPKDQVLKYAIKIINEFLFENEMNIYICVYDKSEYQSNEKTLEGLKDFLKNTLTFNQSFFHNTHFSITSSEPELCCSKLFGNEPLKKSNHNGRVSPTNVSLEEFLSNRDKPFVDALYLFIDRSGMTDVECYKKANIDRKTFSKLKNPRQRPLKKTAVAFAIALELSYEDTQYLLSTAGMTLSRSVVFDEIVRYFIENKNYNLWEINEALLHFDQELLGSM